MIGATTTHTLTITPWRASTKEICADVRAVIERIAEPHGVAVWFIEGIDARYYRATHAQQAAVRRYAASPVQAAGGDGAHNNPFNIVGFVRMGEVGAPGEVWIDPIPLARGVVKGYDGDADVFAAVILLHEIAHAVCGDDEADTILWERPMAGVAWTGMPNADDLACCLTNTEPESESGMARMAADVLDLQDGADPKALPHYWTPTLTDYWRTAAAALLRKEAP